MKFRVLPFDQFLTPYINQIVYLEKTSDDLFVNQVLPTGLAYLNFIFSDSLTFSYPEGEMEVPGGCYIHGQLMKAKITQRIDFALDALLNGFVGWVLKDSIDEFGHRSELVGPKASGRHRRRAQPKPARHEWTLVVERHHVLVGRNPGGFERRLGLLPRQVLVPQIN